MSVKSYVLPQMSHPYFRPRNAATLIIVDDTNRELRVLMGKRHEKHRFMPGKFVFPGGRVDVGDSRIIPVRPLKKNTEQMLSRQLKANAGKNLPRALAMAAVREMFEETGLLIGEPSDNPPTSTSPSWKDFYAERVEPSLDGIEFIARAITPPGRPRRFDTRFFMCDLDHIAARKDLEPSPDNELLELNWLTIDEALTKDLAQITRIVLGEIDARKKGDTDRMVPFYFQRGATVYRNEL